MDLNEIPISKLNDQRFLTNCDLVSFLILIVYSPIGLALLAIRSLMLIVLYIILHIAPNLSSNKTIIKLLLFAFSLRIRFNNDESRLKMANFQHSEIKSLPKIIVCNYTSPFDYLIVKSLINSAKQVNNPSLFSLAFNSGVKHLSSANSKQPVICFPELQNTNGEFGLLEFQFKREDIANLSNSNQILLLSLKHERNNLLPINENYSSGDILSIIINLFHPFKCIYIGTIKDEVTLNIDESEESIKAFNKNLQSTIARDLKLVPTKYSYKDVQRELSKPRVVVRAAQAPAARTPEQLSTDSRFNRILGNIQEVLPDATSHEVCKSIEQTKSYDIDTLIANILDVRATQPVRDAAKAPQQQQQKASNSGNVKFRNPYAEKLRNLTYKERKELLIAESRQRYILRHESNL